MKNLFAVFFTLSLLLSFAGNAAAQNFAATLPESPVNTPPTESTEPLGDGMLSDEQIQELLGTGQAAAPATTEPAASTTAETSSENPPAAPRTTAATPTDNDIVVPPIVPIPMGDAPSSHYTLGPNDVIEITVLRHPEVSGEFPINAEGKIQYDFVGDIEIEGKTKDEAKSVLEEKIAKYIINPEVTVKIIGYNSKVVYVIGEVSHPGKIIMRGDTITVREALIQAGLPMLSAKATKSKLITPATNGKAEQKNVNIHKLLYEGDLRENLVMKPGDTLYVPPTFLAKTMRVIQPVAAPISTAAGTGRTVMTGY